MKSRKWFYATVVLLVICGVLNVLLFNLLRNTALIELPSAYPDLAASLQASSAFRHDQLFLLYPEEIQGQNQPSDAPPDPFKWKPWPIGQFKYSHTYHNDMTFISRFNLRMKSMYEHPEDFPEENQARDAFIASQSSKSQ